MLTAYAISCAVAAFFYGFQTPWGTHQDACRAIATALFWPVVVCIAMGEATRMFSKRRFAEDVSRGMDPIKPRPKS